MPWLSWWRRPARPPIDRTCLIYPVYLSERPPRRRPKDDAEVFMNRTPRRALPALSSLLIVTAVLCFSACQVAQPERVYEIPEADRDVLRGKVIVLDPGHGGAEDGAVGKNGMREADANLRVTMALRDMLEQAGAQVVLTRSTDRTLRLDKRVEMNLEANSDAFISLHHNASGNRFFNRSEVYYHHKEFDGPSEDLADELLKQFEMLYGFPRSRKLVAYAYHVLRENEGVAVLGEPAYLSDPFMEIRLRDDRTIDAQAWAYYHALLNFFDKGVPSIEIQPPRGPDYTLAVEFSDSRSAIDPTSITALHNGKPLPHQYNPATGTLTSSALVDIDGGSHTLTFHARNLNGNRSHWETHEFYVTRQPERLELAVADDIAAGLLRVTAVVTDRQGRRVQDGVPVRVSGNPDLVAADEATVDGEAHFYLPYAGNTQQLAVSAGSLSESINWEGPAASRQGFLVRDAMTGEGIGEAVYQAPAGNKIPADRNGWLAVPMEGAEAGVIAAPGYDEVALPADGGGVIDLRPRLSGLLLGKRIFIDPEEGGEETGPIGLNRLRAADVNLQTARYLRDALEWAGAIPVLVRDDDRSMDVATRAKLALDAEADLYLSIYHIITTGEQNVVQVDYRWQTAQPWATAMAPVIAAYLDATGGAARHRVTQALMHSNENYRSVAVGPGYLNSPALAGRAGTPAYARKEALAILYGLAEGFAVHQEEFNMDRTVHRERITGFVTDPTTGQPVANALVLLNGGLAAQTESDGRFSFLYLAPGEHRLEVIAHGYEPAAETIAASAPGTLTIQLTPKGAT